MADLTAINGADFMQGQLPSQFVGKANITALWRALGAPVTWIENAAVWLQTAFAIETAAGVQMDALGLLLNQPRLGGPYGIGESDVAYRPKLRAAVLRNRSRGTADDLSAIVAALLTGYNPKVHVVDTPPAAFVLTVGVSAPVPASLEQAIGEYVEAAKAAGVNVAAIGWYTAPTFAFATFPDPPYKGYDDGTNTNGGYYARYFWP